MGFTGTEDQSPRARPALHISHAWDFWGRENVKSQAVTEPCAVLATAGAPQSLLTTIGGVSAIACPAHTPDAHAH